MLLIRLLFTGIYQQEFKTGIVGTFGGINIPPVTGFMDGFAWGVKHYNKVKGKNVQVLGWDPDAKEGLFTNNFDSTDDGKAFAQTFMMKVQIS